VRLILYIEVMENEQTNQQEEKTMNIQISFDGPGHYWLTSPDGQGEIALGYRRTEKGVTRAITHTVAQGNGGEDWTDWIAVRTDR
jgi:hypothetical protein